MRTEVKKNKNFAIFLSLHDLPDFKKSRNVDFCYKLWKGSDPKRVLKKVEHGDSDKHCVRIKQK